jgi:hypothetical protein
VAGVSTRVATVENSGGAASTIGTQGAMAWHSGVEVREQPSFDAGR